MAQMTTGKSTFDQLRGFAARIERLDEEIKTLNSDKKEIYAELKGHGFDVKAFKAAHRKHVAQSNDPAGSEEADAMVDLYLAVLNDARGAESESGANVAQLGGHSKGPSRAPARDTQTEPRPEAVPLSLGGAAGDEGTQPVSVTSSAATIPPATGTPMGQRGAPTDETADAVRGGTIDVHSAKSAGAAQPIQEPQPDTVPAGQTAQAAGGLPAEPSAAEGFPDMPGFLRRDRASAIEHFA